MLHKKSGEFLMISINIKWKQKIFVFILLLKKSLLWRSISKGQAVSFEILSLGMDGFR